MQTAQAAFDWSGLVGVPFLENGRGRDGCDCYGLFRLAFHEATGIDLGLYGDAVIDKECAFTSAIASGRSGSWIEIDSGQERSLDGVLMTVRGCQHVGLVVRPGEMLHLPRDSYSSIERYDRPLYARAVQGFFRFKG